MTGLFMNSIRFPLSVLVALIVLIIAQFVYSYQLLPETVASHFDMEGFPNGWMSKSGLVLVIGFAVFISAAPIIGIALFLPHLQDAVNIPNKQYWLAPERKDSALGFVSSSLLWIECAVAGLLLVINHFVLRLNIDGEKMLALPMIPTIAVFITIVGIIIVRLTLKFRKTDLRH